MLSVILPAYNAEQYILRAIDSLQAQTFSDFELIIINDGSTDNTKNIIDRVNDVRIHAVHLTQNAGLINALNLGLSLAKGRYIARMDADDISLPERFAEQIAFLEAHPDYVACGTSIINFTNKLQSYMRYPTTDEEIRIALYFFERNICHPTVMFKRDVIEKHAIRYSTAYPHAEDYWFWVELSRVGKLYNLPKGLVKYYRHQDQISAKYYSAQMDTSRKIVRELITSEWPSISEHAMNNIMKLCVHQLGSYPSVHFTLKEVDRTIQDILFLNKKTQKFDSFYLKRLLYFKRFRCSFYYFYRFNYLTKLRCFLRFFSGQPKRAGADLIMLARIFCINRINKW